MKQDTPKEHTTSGEPAVQRLLHRAEEFARREPAKAMATAFGAGLLLNVLPARFIAGAVTAVAVPFMRPTLLALGLYKAFELCCQDDAGDQGRSPGGE